jgi:glycine cleavage system H protein
VKAVSELYAPVSGEVVEVNGSLSQRPESINADPHGAWMIVLKVANPGDTGELLDSASYEKLTA